MNDLSEQYGAKQGSEEACGLSAAVAPIGRSQSGILTSRLVFSRVLRNTESRRQRCFRDS